MKKPLFNMARSLLPLFAALILAAMPAVAKSHGATELLNGYFASEDKEYERAIRHYSRAIESDSLSLMQMSDAYRARGDAHFFLQRIHRALDDYNLALHLNPENAPALNNRGNAYTKKGLFVLAMTDFNTALRLDPEFALAYQNRANVHFYFGRYREAAKDYAVSSKLDPSDPFSAIWLFLARKRGAINGMGELERSVSAVNSDDWASSVVAMLLGKKEPDRFLAAAKRENKIGEICEAHFYVGQLHLLNGDRSKAMKQFRRASGVCPVTYVEHTAAEMELEALRQKKHR